MNRLFFLLNITIVIVLLIVAALGYKYIKYDYIVNNYIFSKVKQNVKNELSGKDTKLQEIKLKLSDESLSLLEGYVQEKIETGDSFGGDNKYVKGKIFSEGNTYDVKVRLRGDMVRNFNGGLLNSSLTIKSEEALWNSYDKFSLLRPIQEYYMYGYLYYEFMKSEGFVSPDFKLVKVKLNESNNGVFIFQQAFTKYLKNQSSSEDGFYLKFKNDCRNGMRSKTIERSPDLTVYQKKELKKDKERWALWKNIQAKYFLVETGKIKAGELFDIDAFAKFGAISDLFLSHHSDICHNVRMFYNPDSKMLEPIAWDPHLHDVVEINRKDNLSLLYSNGPYNKTIFNLLYKDIGFIQSYEKYLIEYTKNGKLESFLDNENEYILSCEKLLVKGRTYSGVRNQKFIDHINIIKDVLNQSKLTKSLIDFDKNILMIKSKSEIPLIIEHIMVDDSVININERLFPNQLKEFSINIKKGQKIKVVSKYNSIDSEKRIDKVVRILN